MSSLIVREMFDFLYDLETTTLGKTKNKKVTGATFRENGGILAR